jgi:hypothetical protein
MTAAELDVALSRWRPGHGASITSRRTNLRELHDLLMRATPALPDPPLARLEAAAALAGEIAADVIDAMAPRPRTVFRLLRSNSLTAAWAVLVENASGIVDGAWTSWRLPLLTRIESGSVFAELPGFRDPRYAAPDDCYDITETIALKHGLDEICSAGAVLAFGGWAALDVLSTDANEQVRLIATGSNAEVAVVGRRIRRPDLVTARGEALTRRAWAGWAAGLDLADEAFTVGGWALWLDVDHEGVSRRVPLGASSGHLAQAATNAVTRVGTRSISWDVSARPWRLVISHYERGATSDPVGG